MVHIRNFFHSSTRSCALVLVVVAAALPAVRAAPVLDYGVSAFLAADAGNAHWFVNGGGAGVVDTGLITQGLSDNALGGAQAALIAGYASVGALGGAALVSSGGALLAGAQAFNDLSWYSDLLITGTPGTRVAIDFGTTLDGFVVTGGLPPPLGSAGSRVTATTFVAGIPLAAWDFSTAIGPGPFDVAAHAVHEFDVGSVVRVGSRLTVAARAEFFSTAEADALHTTRFFVDVLTPGGGYVAGGGVVFPNLPDAQVPEPAPLALAAAALLAALLPRRLRARRRAAAAAWLAAAAAWPLAQAAPSYRYTPFDVAGSAETQLYGIDDSGRMVGAWRDAAGTWRGFVAQGGSVGSIVYPGAAYTDAFGIAPGGAIVGSTSPVAAPGVGDFVQGYLRSGTSYTPLVVAGAEATGAFGVNGAGVVVGGYIVESAGVRRHHGARWAGGTLTTIDVAGADDTTVAGINEAGQIVGGYASQCAGCAWGGFLWSAGVVTPIVPFGAARSGAFGINDLGDIVGWLGEGDDLSGWLLDDGVFFAIEPPGARYAEASDINNLGVIVGSWADANGAIHGFIATPAQVPAPGTAALTLLAAALGLARRRARLQAVAASASTRAR